MIADCAIIASEVAQRPKSLTLTMQRTNAAQRKRIVNSNYSVPTLFTVRRNYGATRMPTAI
jgi:hypothetical protein